MWVSDRVLLKLELELVGLWCEGWEGTTSSGLEVEAWMPFCGAYRWAFRGWGWCTAPESESEEVREPPSLPGLLPGPQGVETPGPRGSRGGWGH